MALLGATYGLLSGTSGSAVWKSAGLGALGGATLGLLYFLVLQPWFERRSARRSPGLVGTFEAELGPYGFKLRPEDGAEVHRSWSDLAQLSPDPEHLVFYWKDGLATLLPRRALGARGEEEVRDLIRGRGNTLRPLGRNGRARPAEPGIEVQLERTPEDLAHYAWYQNLHDPTLRMRSWFSYALAAGTTIFVVAAVAPWWAAILAGLGVTAVLPRLYFGLLKQQGAAMLRQAGPPQVTVRFDAAGVTESAGGSSAKVRWADVQRLELTPRLLLIYVDRFQAVVVPRRFLGTEDEAQARLKQVTEWHEAGRTSPTRTKAKR